MLTASTLRADIYRYLDQVLAEGTPLIVERKGRRIALVPDQPTSRMARLARMQPRGCILGDPATLPDAPTAAAWSPDLP